MNDVEGVTERTYQIGTVSNLTGLDPNTIRAWERRHGAIKPTRTETGRRRYDDETVERLQLLKALVECNESIGMVAHLPDNELRTRLERLADLGNARPLVGATATDHPATIRASLLAPTLVGQLAANSVAIPEFEQRIVADDREVFLTEARRQPSDVVLLELECIGESPLGFVQACRTLPGSPIVLVLYRFARREVLARLARTDAKLVQAPLRLEQLRRIVIDHLTIERARSRTLRMGAHTGSKDRVAVPAAHESDVGIERLFGDEQLSRLFEVSVAVECECPNHLSSLVSALVAFETYSNACESRNDADAALHRRLARGTGGARLQLEELLRNLCEHEGIPI